MPNFKTGKLVDVSPQAQYYSQMIGSVVGVFVSGTAYRVFTSIYSVQDGSLQAPLAHLWIVTARPAYGKGLPEQSAKFALTATIVSAIFAVIRLSNSGKWWRNIIPGGVAVAIGMSRTPARQLFTKYSRYLSSSRSDPRASDWWCHQVLSFVHLQAEDFSIISIASGLIIGKGVFGIFGLAMSSLGVPHLSSVE